MSDFDALQPVRTTAANFTTEVANSSGTTINPAEDYAQGSTTSGQNGVLIQGAVTTSTPTYSTGTTQPLSIDVNGNLRVAVDATVSEQNVNLNQVGGSSITIGQATMAASLPVVIASNQSAITVSGTVTSNQGTPNSLANGWPVEITDGTNILGTSSHPVRIDPTGTTTQPVSGTVAVTQSTSPWVTKDQADGPVTPGTVASFSILTGGQYNSTPPTLTNGQQAALQVDSNGRLLVDSTAINPTPVLTYFTDAAVASGSTTTHSLAGPVTLDKIDFTASGEMKGTVAIGITGSEVTYWQGFNSASNQDFSFVLNFPYTIPTGSSAKVTLKNRDTAAQDLYVTFFSH